MKIFRRVSLILIALILVFSVCACSGNQTKEPTEIILVLTRAESAKLLDYTAESFADVNCIELHEQTAAATAAYRDLKKISDGEKSWYSFSDERQEVLKEYQKKSAAFIRIFTIYIDSNSELSIEETVEKLSAMEGVLSVTPKDSISTETAQ